MDFQNSSWLIKCFFHIRPIGRFWGVAICHINFNEECPCLEQSDFNAPFLICLGVGGVWGEGWLDMHMIDNLEV